MASGLSIALSVKIGFSGWVRKTGLLLLFRPQWREAPQMTVGKNFQELIWLSIFKGSNGWILPENEKVWKSLRCND